MLGKYAKALHGDDPRAAFDAAIGFALDVNARMQAAERLREARELRMPRTRCGDCNLWMKSRECPRERNVNGRQAGPSANSPKCDRFVEDPLLKRLRMERAEELCPAPPVSGEDGGGEC